MNIFDYHTFHSCVHYNESVRFVGRTFPKYINITVWLTTTGCVASRDNSIVLLSKDHPNHRLWGYLSLINV